MDQAAFFHTGMPGAYAVIYYPTNGDPVSTVALIDFDVQPFPGGFDSSVAEKRTEMSLRYDHVPNPKRGDRISVGDESYEVDAEIFNDRFEVRVAVSNG